MLNSNEKPSSFPHYMPVASPKFKLATATATARLKVVKQNLDYIRQQTHLNNDMNRKTRNVLINLSCNSSVNNNNQNIKQQLQLNQKQSHQPISTSDRQAILDLIKCSSSAANQTAIHTAKRSNNQFNSAKISKINSELINYVKLRERYMQHANYWQQIWLFTDNPIFEYENYIGFDNPTYTYLNAKENNYIHKEECLPILDVAVMNIYESILDLNQTKPRNSSLISSSTSIGINNNCELESICSPDSNDSGIHSDTHLSRHQMTSSITTHTTHDDFSSEKACSINGEDSLYSSVMSKKSSTDFLSREFSSSSKLADSADEDESASSLFHNIKHVEQHELPLGWIRCCDENGGIYYWHKPTGTVTRRPPTSSLLNQSTTPTLVQPSTPLIPEKNFDINEFKQLNSILTTVKPVSPVTGASNINNKLSLTSSSASSTSSGSANQLPGSGMHSDFESNYTEDYDEEINQLKIEINNKTNQLVHTGSSSCSALDVDTSKSSTSADTANTKQSQINKRFYVRSLGWVKIDENDLTPERSSKAVNRCINDLSRGFRDINDVVARWGEGKDLYLDLEDSYLILTDPKDDNVLNKQPITSIRVWGVGRDNGRDFAYVARDKQTKIHMCHVFRCDSAPAKDIANCLRDTCRHIINEKKSTSLSSSSNNSSSSSSSSSNTSSTLLKRPSFLPDISSKFNNAKFKSLSCHDHNELMSSHSVNTRHFETTEEIRSGFLSPCDEPKKSIKCRYLGTTLVTRPSGMDVLNEAIEKVYMKSLDDYKRTLKQKKFRNYFQRNNNNNTYDELDEENDDNEEYDFDSMFSFSLLDLNGDKDLGTQVEVSISPSTISVRKVAATLTPNNMHQANNTLDENLILECRVRYLSFMGISIDARLCGFIMHCADNTFRCHAFLCENSSGQLCKTIEAACKLRYAKCLDAHPEAATDPNSDSIKTSARFGFLGSQLKNMFDSFRTKNIFSMNNNSASANNNK